MSVEQSTVRKGWTAAGLAVALFGIPAVTLAYRLLIGETANTGQLLLREGAIFAMLGLLLLIIRRGERLPFSSIGLHASGFGRSLLWGLLAFLLLGLATALALGLLHVFGLHYGGGHAAFVPPLWATCLVVLRAGIVEEVCYRGYAIERLQALTGSRWIAGLVSLIAFASFHYRQGIAGILVALILGAVLTGFYLWRRNLAANMTGHFLIDFVPNVVLPAIGG
ncbi:CPBP family intramembrane glutamic endopeptidase [Sphingomonas sp. MMS24-J13]|uniref:CPBP family intramembrane glutamic endopeptidase n=1 Tax=Sphingomonas sp. MMS24-J13 TaxID=3238686 RepID=UPI0038513D5E